MNNIHICARLTIVLFIYYCSSNICTDLYVSFTSDDQYQTTAVTCRRRRWCVSSDRLVLARTAAQVADLSSQHPRHGRHLVFLLRRRLYDVVLLYFSRLITDLQEKRVEMLRIFAAAPYNRYHHRSSTFTMSHTAPRALLP